MDQSWAPTLEAISMPFSSMASSNNRYQFKMNHLVVYHMGCLQNPQWTRVKKTLVWFPHGLNNYIIMVIFIFTPFQLLWWFQKSIISFWIYPYKDFSSAGKWNLSALCSHKCFQRKGFSGMNGGFCHCSNPTVSLLCPCLMFVSVLLFLHCQLLQIC